MTRLGADRLADDLAFVGRRTELSRLEQWIGECRQGHARMVTVLGGPGVGKTALADEFVRRSRVGTIVYSASFHDDVGVPFLPVVGAIGRSDLLLGDLLLFLSSCSFLRRRSFSDPLALRSRPMAEGFRLGI